MENTQKPILICGGAGYIGSHVVRHLLGMNLPIVIVDDLSSGHIESIPRNAEFINVSIGDRNAMSSLFKKFDFQAVVHLCANAYVGESVANPRKYYSNNIGAGLVLLETMLDHDVRQIVFSSSCTVYGYPNRIPIDEDCTIAPISPYGHTKAMFEQIMSDFSHAHGLRYCALRYFNAAGAMEDGTIGEDHDPETHLIPLVLRQAMVKEYPNMKLEVTPSLRVFGDDYATPDGTCVRDYIHVMDLASAHRLALDYLQNGGDSVALNLSNEKGFSVLEIIRTCEEITGHTIPFEIACRRPGDPDKLVGAAAKAADLLGWKPSCSNIHTIIRTAWDWQKHLPKTMLPVDTKGQDRLKGIR